MECSDLLLFSVTALADEPCRAALEETAVRHGRKVFLPHGAIIGMDGLMDAGPTLKSATGEIEDLSRMALSCQRLKLFGLYSVGRALPRRR